MKESEGDGDLSRVTRSSQVKALSEEASAPSSSSVLVFCRWLMLHGHKMVTQMKELPVCMV